MISAKSNDQHSAPAAIIAHAPSSAEDAFVIPPQDVKGTIRIAFASKPGRSNVAEGERAAIGHTRWRTGYLWRNRYFLHWFIDVPGAAKFVDRALPAQLS